MLKKRERELLSLGRNGIVVADLGPKDRALAMRMSSYGWLRHFYEEGAFRLNLSPRGLEELRRPAPPPKPGRIQCVNPVCAVSVPQEKHPGCDAIICGRCFRMTGDLRTEYRKLHALWRRIEKRRARRQGETVAIPIGEVGVLRRMNENWAAIVRFFTAPEKPEGLETFLDEMGWTDDPDQQQPIGTQEL